MKCQAHSNSKEISNSADFFCAVFIDDLEVQKGQIRKYSEALKDRASQSMTNLVVKLQVCPAANLRSSNTPETVVVSIAW